MSDLRGRRRVVMGSACTSVAFRSAKGRSFSERKSTFPGTSLHAEPEPSQAGKERAEPTAAPDRRPNPIRRPTAERTQPGASTPNEPNPAPARRTNPARRQHAERTQRIVRRRQSGTGLMKTWPCSISRLPPVLSRESPLLKGYIRKAGGQRTRNWVTLRPFR